MILAALDSIYPTRQVLWAAYNFKHRRLLREPEVVDPVLGVVKA